MHFLVVLIFLSNSARSEESRKEGLLHYGKTGKTEYIKKYVLNSKEVEFTTCTDIESKVNKDEVEFIEKDNICASLTLEAYKEMLEKVAPSIVKLQRVKNIRFVIPPSQDFEAINKITRDKIKLTSLEIVRGNELKIEIDSSLPQDKNLVKEVPSSSGKRYWYDSTGLIEVQTER